MPLANTHTDTQKSTHKITGNCDIIIHLNQQVVSFFGEWVPSPSYTIFCYFATPICFALYANN